MPRMVMDHLPAKYLRGTNPDADSEDVPALFNMCNISSTCFYVL